jgi:hypothetical protein
MERGSLTPIIVFGVIVFIVWLEWSNIAAKLGASIASATGSSSSSNQATVTIPLATVIQAATAIQPVATASNSTSDTTKSTSVG